MRTGVTELESGKSAGASVQGTFDNVKLHPETGHYYESVHHGGLVTWTEAKRQAESRQYFSRRGHLLTVTSPAESAFVRQYLDLQSYWIGGYQDKTAPDYSEPSGGSRWVTGEPMAFTDWNGGEPNDGNGLSNFMHYFPGSNARWNDTEDNDFNFTGYIVEYE